MRILVVVGSCLKVNSSANLCHNSYINGLVELGHDVSALCVSEKGQNIDPSINLNSKVEYIQYNGTFFYFLFNKNKRNELNKKIDEKEEKSSIKIIIYKNLRSLLMKTYGSYGFLKAWIKKSFRFQSKKAFDLVISLAWPPASHKLTYNLIKHNHIKTQFWCQIWEDPWQLDLYQNNRNNKIFNEERKLVSYGNAIIYVSPITLKNQQKLFSVYKDKMDWCPLPYYYKTTISNNKKNSNYNFGYFGDYHPHVRNLQPFYEAAVSKNINLTICGKPSNLFKETNTIKIKPRLPLNELEVIENNTSILVFVANLEGGQIPGKIYQYSATNKIILFILDGDEREKIVLKKYFQQFNRYIFCNNNKSEIENAIEKILMNDNKGISNEPVEFFSPKNVAQSIIKKCQNKQC